MKKLILMLFGTILYFCVVAQAPQKMSYQSVIRDANNTLVTETNVGIQITILQYSSEGSLVYMETHAAMTNANGLVSLELGMGTPEDGTFPDIDWGDGPYFILTETDPEGGTNYTLSGVSELLSVPYAFYASAGGDAVFSTEDNITSNANGNYETDDFVFGSPTLDDDGPLFHEARMFYDKSKGAFRVGRAIDDQWDDENVGSYSTATGYNTIASGYGSTAIGFGSIATGTRALSMGWNTLASEANSTAMGVNTYASGYASTAIGNATSASGSTSFAMGQSTSASGSYSTAMGSGSIAGGSFSTAMGAATIAPSFAETSIGVYNTLYDPVSDEFYIPTDRLFVIGNGENFSTRSDAMVVLKNGNVGIGTSSPNELLEVAGDGRAFFGDGGGGNRKGLLIDGTWLSTATRIESYDYTTGLGLDLVFNDIGNGDVGIKVSNPNVSLDVSGSIEYTGTITDVSDERLKENFESIENPLASISQIQGYSYNMKDDEDPVREYGVIAQEIQKVFPELVTVVDEENGYLGVSYVQLIPILLEAIKEQQEMIVGQNTRVQNLETKLSQKTSDYRTLCTALESQQKLVKSNTLLLQELNSLLKTQAQR